MFAADAVSLHPDKATVYCYIRVMAAKRVSHGDTL